MNDTPKAPAPAPAPAEASAFDVAAWRKQLLDLNTWARGPTIDENDQAFLAARQKATLERHAQSMETWNDWANGMLALKATLEKAAQWAAKPTFPWETPSGANEETRQWLALAVAVFSTDARKHTFETWFSCDHFIFPGAAWFDGALFSRGVSFSQTIFTSVATFTGATFSDKVWFQRAAFSRAHFHNANFHSRASFLNATFAGYAEFEDATFFDVAEFSIATFSDEVQFHAANFRGKVEFEHAKFFGAAWFAEVTFDRFVTFSRVQFGGAVALVGSIFKRGASFEAMDAQAAFSLADATFHQVPSFIGATFKGTLRLDNVATPQYRLTLGWSPDKNASAHFRELKRRAVEAQDRDRELEFFAQEIRTSRFLPIVDLPIIPRVWSWRFWFGLAYGAFSDFGRSLWRPTLVWLALVVGFAVFYLGQHESQQQTENKPDSIAAYLTTARAAWANPPDCVAPDTPLLAKTNIVQEALFLSASNALVVFNLGRGDVSRRTYGCLYGFEHGGAQAPPIMPYRVAVASTIQTLLSAILIFLFLLAVRNLLRLK